MYIYINIVILYVYHTYIELSQLLSITLWGSGARSLPKDILPCQEETQNVLPTGLVV